jgi:uncharacterized protein (DUF433 family)
MGLAASAVFRRNGARYLSFMATRIEADPRVCGGQPIVCGTRVPIHVVLDLLAAGETIEGILGEYPQLTREDVLAVLEYAAGLAREEIQPFDAHRT